MSVPDSLSDEEYNDDIIQIPVKEVIKGPMSKKFYLAMLALESQVLNKSHAGKKAIHQHG